MNKNNMRFCVGGLLMVIFSALNLFSIIIRNIIGLWNVMSYNPGAAWDVFGNILVNAALSYLIPLILGIMLLIRKPGLPVTIVSGIGVLAWVVYPFTNGMHPYTLIPALVTALVYVSVLLLSLSYLVKELGAMRKLWFLPGALYAVYFVLTLTFDITLFIANDYPTHYIISTTVGTVFSDVSLTLAFFLAGHWMGKPWKKQPVAAPAYGAPTPAYAPPVYSAPVQTPPVQEPDPRAQMAYYEQLYHNGEITEQAYLNIRRQLIGQ